MDNYSKIKELKAERERKQKIFLAIGYLVLVVICTNAADGNFIAGTILATIAGAFIAGPMTAGFAVYNESAQLEDCKRYLSKETYNKLMQDKVEYDAQQAEQQKQELLTPNQKFAAKTAAAGYIGYKVGKGIAKW